MAKKILICLLNIFKIIIPVVLCTFLIIFSYFLIDVFLEDLVNVNAQYYTKGFGLQFIASLLVLGFICAVIFILIFILFLIICFVNCLKEERKLKKWYKWLLIAPVVTYCLFIMLGIILSKIG